MLPKLTIKDCNTILSNYTKNEQSCSSFELNRISAEVLGFLGEHFKLTIHCVNNNNDEVMQYNFFVKTLPNLKAKHLDYIKRINAFQKEVSLYQNVLPEFQEYFQEKFLPNCYFLKRESIIVLEDLSLQGYGMKIDFLNYDECECLIKSLSKLHAASIIYEEKRTTKIKLHRINEEFPDAIKEATFIFDDDNHPRKLWLTTATKAIIDCVNLMPEYSNNVKLQEKLLKFIKRDLNSFVKPSKKFRNTVSHADLWKNNALFKRNKLNETECVLIDFQLARYAPPAFDILSSLYLNFTSQFLEENIDNILNTYYSEFCENLKLHDINSDDIMSSTEFLKSINLYKLPALFEASTFATIIFINKELANLITTNERIFEEFMLNNRSKHVCKEFRENKLFRERCSDLFKSLIDELQNSGL